VIPLYGYNQEFIVFERKTGLNSKQVHSNLFLSQTDVVLKSGDTTVRIFNYYYSSEKEWIGPLNVKSLYENTQHLKSLANDVLITAVPLINPGDTLLRTKITEKELLSLNVVSPDQMLKNALPLLYTHATSRDFSMPALKTIQYKLIIKEGNQYYKITQPILVVYNLICNDLWYFPNEFKDGILTVSDRYIKKYNISDFERMRNETGNNGFLWKKLYDRTYISNVSDDNDFNARVFSYWEFPNGDVQSISLKPKVLRQYHPGLGSFSLLPKIGIVNCTLDYYLKNQILFNQRSSFQIISVNSRIPKEFGALLKRALPKAIKGSE